MELLPGREGSDVVEVEKSRSTDAWLESVFELTVGTITRIPSTDCT